MSRLPIAPTKGNLITVKEEFGLAKEAHELLERKRDVLVNEIMRFTDRLREVEKEFLEKFGRGLSLFRTARTLMGRARTRQALDFPLVENEIGTRDRSVMGVRIMELSIDKAAAEPLPGFAESVPELDQAASQLQGALLVLGEYITRMGSVWRLANEIRKTQRRLNALENIFIPQYEATKSFIESALEEGEREEFFRQKRVKSKIARAQAQ